MLEEIEIDFCDTEIEEEEDIIKNKCEECGKGAYCNYIDKDYGIRCKRHKLDKMVNVFTPELCSIRFYKRIEEMGGKVIGEYRGKDIPIDCICKEGHRCSKRPSGIQQGEGICKICSGKDHETAKNNFYKKIEDLGGTVIGEYKNKDTPVDCKCSEGHYCKSRPHLIRNGQGMCRVCSGKDPETAKNNFYKKIKDLGGKVIGDYKGSKTHIECVCPNGHICAPSPDSIKSDQGMCMICSGKDPETAKNNFYEKIKELGATVIGEYKGSKIPVECICSDGHICNPRPNSVQQGQGICKICSCRDLENARDNFYRRIEELGGIVIGDYINNHTQIECICAEGHLIVKIPRGIQQGEGICRICAKNNPETSRNNFYIKVKKLGGKVVGEYMKSYLPVECVCPNNHKCSPSPNSIRGGNGMCKICAKNDPETAKNNFYKKIRDLGGKVTGEYKKSIIRVKCICSEGHECNPLPNSVQQGNGMCGICKYKTEKVLIEHCNNIGFALPQFNPEWCRNIKTNTLLRFDVLISDKLIIELDGNQHFNDMECWNSLSSEVQSRDIYKMKKAFDNGYSLLRLSQEEVWKNKIDWKQIIKDCLKELETDDSPKVWFHSIDENLYESHITKLMECFTDIEAEKRIELNEEILEDIECEI